MFKVLQNKKKGFTPIPKFFGVSSRSERGFSLIEMMVAITLFSAVAVISIGALLSLVDANKKQQSLKSSMNNLHFAIESMSREIRTGSLYNCSFAPIQGITSDCPLPLGGDWFGFVSSKGDFIEYRKIGSQLTRKINGVPPFISMTSPEISIDTLNFYVTGSLRGAPDSQPLVTIIISGTSGVRDKTKTDFSIQATVTQRVPDF